MKWPPVAIIILTLNEKKLLKNCLNSLDNLTYPKNKIKIIVVDNGSNDGSIDFIKKHSTATLISNSSNIGFAKANNQGILKALKDKKVKYLITLNNDTQVDKKWLKILVTYMEKNKGAGMAVGKMLKLGDRDKIDSAGDFFAKHTFRVVNRGAYQKDKGQYNKSQEALSACAAASIFRRKALEEARIDNEFFDENFVSYIEDVDLNIRARLAGWKCFYVPSAIICHVGSASFSKMPVKYKEFLSRRNRILMVVKNFPARQMFFLLWQYILPSKKGLRYYPVRGPKTNNQNKVASTKSSSLTIFEASFVHLKAVIGAIILLPKIIRKRNLISKRKKITNQEIERWFRELTI